MASRTRKTELNALKAELEAATPAEGSTGARTGGRTGARRAAAAPPPEPVAPAPDAEAPPPPPPEIAGVVEAAKAGVEDAVAQAHGVIRAHPLRAIAIAFAAGFVLSRLGRR